MIRTSWLMQRYLNYCERSNRLLAKLMAEPLGTDLFDELGWHNQNLIKHQVEAYDQVAAAISTVIHDKSRRVLELSFLYGFSNLEVTEFLKCSRNTVFRYQSIGYKQIQIDEISS